MKKFGFFAFILLTINVLSQDIQVLDKETGGQLIMLLSLRSLNLLALLLKKMVRWILAM